MKIAAGCDGGGTKCTVRILAINDQGVAVQLGQASAGPANVRSNPELALQNVCNATEQAICATNLPPNTVIDCFVAALAGAGSSEQRDKWKIILGDNLPTREASVIADIEALFAAVELSAERAAIATVVGTGSIAWAKFPDDRMQRAGGLGPELGDEGSGYWIGNQAIRRCYEAGETSEIHERIVGRFSNQSIAELHENLSSHQLMPAAVADLSVDVFELADNDNKLATHILQSAARHITTLLHEVAAGIISSHSNPIPWIAAGGVAVNQPEWLQSIREACSDANVHLTEPMLVREPVAGAARIAQDRLSVDSME